MASAVEDAISQLKQDLDVELDRDLASRLRVDASTVAGWRRRGSVPEKYRLRAARELDERAAESPYGAGHLLREAYIFALVRLVSLQLGEDISGRGSYDELWAGFRLAKLYEFLWKDFDHRRDGDWWRKRYEQRRAEIEAAYDLAIWLETLS